MDDDFDPETHHRNTDPDTSSQSARNLSRERLRRHKRAIIEAHRRLLLDNQYEGLTAREAAEASGVDPYDASKRCSDLMGEGKLEWLRTSDPQALVDREGFLCRRNETGKLARIQVLTVAGAQW